MYIWYGKEDWSGKVFEGDFKVDELVTSLKGCPKEVTGDFICCDNYKLKSLKGAPEKVGGKFDCGSCENLETLKGAPKEVGGDFVCYSNNSLTSLLGAPEKVGGNFICSYCYYLESLKGCPEYVGENIYLNGCVNLKIIDDFPFDFGKVDFEQTPIEKVTLNAILKIGDNYTNFEYINDDVLKYIEKFAKSISDVRKYIISHKDDLIKISKVFFNK